MYNTIINLIKFAKTDKEVRKLEELSDKAIDLIRVKILKQDILNLIDPKKGKYETSIDRVELDF